MPREGAVNGIVKNSIKFDFQLHDFLGRDYEGLSPDKAAFPDSDSLVGKNGEFILYRLTGGPIFDSLQSSMHSLSIVGENLLAETPGKAAFDWIKASVSWIERLNDSVTTESPFVDTFGKILVIPGTEAREILKQGETFFLSIPEDLKRTLSQHGIFVSTNKQEKTLRVVLKKDGAHHSVGGKVIRWCPILFDCLRADVGRLDGWERDLTMVLSQFNAFFSDTRNLPNSSAKALYQWFCFREQIAELLNEGKESLVISPQKGLVDSFRNLHKSMNDHLEKYSNPELNQSFAKKWFAQDTSLVDDRSLLLESLLYRKSIAEKESTNAGQLPLATQPLRIFRDACRSYIEKSFSRALKAAGLTSVPRMNDYREIDSYPALKAWEIENEMFERFQSELGVSRVSEEYRSKARSLRCSLEDSNNLSLCLKVLTGGISVVQLVSMTSEQLASQKVKLQRSRAEQAAKASALLTSEFKIMKATKEDSNTESETQQMTIAELSDMPNHAEETNGILAAKGVGPGLEVSTGAPKLDNPQEILPAENKRNSPVLEISPGALKAVMKPSTKSSRPPPPPSLVRTFQKASDERAESPPSGGLTAKDRGIRVANSAGGDRYRIDINNPRLAFSAAFYLEDESHSGVDQFLPESLSEKGRLKIHEFSRFLTDKLTGGKWVAIPLRLTTLSDQDAKYYKRFYKEYEIKQRIAMFSINGSKLFLVTPKFHGAAKSTGFVSLPNKHSTYGIVLTKEIGVLMD